MKNDLPRMKYLLILLITLSLNYSLIASGDPAEEITVFLDCSFCNENQMKREMDYLNFAVDALRSDVHVFLTQQFLPTGARQYNIELIGQDKWEGEKVSFSFVSEPQMTSLELNELIISKIKIGLVPFLVKTTLAESMEVNIEKRQSSAQTLPASTFWSNFIYELGGRFEFDSEAARKKTEFRFNLDIDNVSPEWRTRIRSFFHYIEQNITTNDETVTSIRKRNYNAISTVKSVNNNISAGLFSSYYIDNFRNLESSLWLAPALEYSFFSYDDVPSREFTVAYRIGYVKQDYLEETIYGQLEEGLYRHMLDIDLRMRRPWGSVFAGISGSNYLDDWSKNRVSFNGNLSFRVFKGLSVQFGGNYEIINDQISLAKGEATLEDIALSVRQAATNFESGMNVGINYTFGALYNNVINTRL